MMTTTTERRPETAAVLGSETVAVVANLMYEGKAKRVFATDDPERYLVQYKNDATAFNGRKRAQIGGKGALNNAISSELMQRLQAAGVSTHFIEKSSEIEQLVRAVEIVPLEVVVRNIAAGSLARRLGLKEGHSLEQPIVEFYYKRDDLDDPLLTRSHIAAVGIASSETVDELERLALQVNTVLLAIFQARGITVVDFKLEFGHTAGGELLLADEISPDTCRFWDSETKRKLDKDRFRRDLGGVSEAYQEIFNRLIGVSS